MGIFGGVFCLFGFFGFFLLEEEKGNLQENDVRSRVFLLRNINKRIIIISSRMHRRDIWRGLSKILWSM